MSVRVSVQVGVLVDWTVQVGVHDAVGVLVGDEVADGVGVEVEGGRVKVEVKE